MKKFRLMAMVLAAVLCVSFFGFNFGTANKVNAETNWELHYWNFDDSMNDAAGAYNFIGEAAYAAGKNGKALDPTAMDVAPKTEKLTCNTLNGFTMGAWVYINNGADGWNIVMSKGNTNAAEPDRFQIHFFCDAALGGGRLLVYSPGTRGNGYPDIDQDGQTIIVPYETWTYIATTWNGNSAKVFMNGEKKFEVEIERELEDSIGAYQNIRVGALNDGTTFKFNGLIDDAFYGNYAMTEADIKAAYNSVDELKAWADGSKAIVPDAMKEREEPVATEAPAEPETGLIFYWPFENNYQDMSHKEFDFDFDDMCPDFTEGKAGQGVWLVDSSICTDLFDDNVVFKDFTLSFWFRWDGIAAGALPYYILAALGDKAQDYHFELYIRSEDCETGSLCIYNPGGLVVNDMAILVPEQFYHIAMVNSEAGGFRVYLDGELVFKRGGMVNISALTAGDEKFTLGALQDYSLLSYGVYDEVILADHALSDELVAKLYTDPAAAAEDVTALVKANYPENYARATPKPTPEPTEVPTDAPATEVPTDAPATAVPAKTPAKSTGTKSAGNNNTAVIIIIIVAAVAVVGIVVAIILVLKKKK